jgi:hypothetical protein
VQVRASFTSGTLGVLAVLMLTFVAVMAASTTSALSSASATRAADVDLSSPTSTSFVETPDTAGPDPAAAPHGAEGETGEFDESALSGATLRTGVSGTCPPTAPTSLQPMAQPSPEVSPA